MIVGLYCLLVFEGLSWQKGIFFHIPVDSSEGRYQSEALFGYSVVTHSRPVRLIEIGERSLTGISSGAVRCKGEDGRYYYVKTPKLAGAGSVVREWIAARLALHFHLPAREGVMVEIPVEFAALPVAAALGTGKGFGSLELPQADLLTWHGVEQLPRPLRATVLLFDYWIQNADRTLGPAGGNPNLLRAHGVPLALIDHGNAFDSAFDVSIFKGHHAFASCVADWLDRKAQREWMVQAVRASATIPDLWNFLPEEWHENTFGDSLHDLSMENTLSILSRIEDSSSAFWTTLLTP
jgi:hypothetical protein